MSELPLSFSFSAPPTPSPSTQRPTPSPSTVVPTQAPTPDSSTTGFTPSPTEHPSEELGECNTAYAYCPGRSTCFIGNIITSGGGGTNGPWGWSIDLDGVNFTGGQTLTCPVYAGAGQCDFENKGTYVGNLVISLNSVRWDFDSQVGGEDFHLYAGKCPGNDKGLHLEDGVCDASDMDQFARTNGQYSLVAGTYGPVLQTFQFDNTNHLDNAFRKGIWRTQNYQVFPIQNPGRRYLSAHTTVCPIATDDVAEGSVAGATRAGSTATGNSLSAGAMAGIVIAAVVVAVAIVGALTYNNWKGQVTTANTSNSAGGSVSSLSAAGGGGGGVGVDGEMEEISLNATDGGSA